MGAESGMNSSVRDDRVALSDGAKALWGKTNRIDDSEWLPLYVHMVDSAAMASKIWDTWVPQGTKAVIVGDLGNDEVLARKLMIFMAGIHDIGKATPVFQAKSITFGPEAGSFAWKAERAGLPMIAGLRGTNHPTHPIAGEIILEGYLLRVRGWERKAARQYACVVGGHHGTPPDKSKIDEEKNRKTNVGLDSEAWVSTQDELIDFVANIAGIEEKEWEDLSERRFSVQSAVLMTGLVIMADWIASNSDEDMFPLVRTEPWADEDEDFFFSESGEEDDIQSWSGLRIRADRAWSCVQLPHAWVPEGIPSSCQDLFATRFTLPEGAKVRPVQEEAVRIARDTRQPGLMVIEAPMGEGKTEAALAAAEILAQRTGRGGVCVALPTMATTDAMFTRVRRWLEALPSCDFDNEKTVWLAHGKAQLNNDFRGIIAASHRRFSSVDQDDVKQESSQNRKKKQIDVPPETVVSDWLWGRKKGALANFLVCTVDQVLMSALQMKHVVLRQLAMANKVVIIDECHAYDAYMQEYLKMALEWLGGYRTPVILLSATLPECQRNAMVEAYLKGWCDTEPRKASKVSILEQLRARNASNTHHINHTANSEMSCEKGTAEKLRLISNAYPLLTYTDGHETKHADVKPSGRSMKVQCRLVDDDDTALLDLMDALLVDGGCIGVICDTVGRAQHAAELLGNHCGRDCVRLTHSRFMDIDRMSNERELRDLLGPDATIGNGKRPGKLVVVGTQVLEQSLDIDFDALVTDIAPVDLIMQRLGRVHRHRRGDGECDRPVSLQTATCYIRGVEAWNNEGPKFSRGADSVYDAAALMESLAVLDLTAAGASCAQQLPQDIARTVRSAYGNDPHGFLPHMWLPQYDDACEKRDLGKRTKGVVTLIADSITSKRPDLAESAEGLAQKVMAAAGFKVKASDRAGADKGSLATDYLIFIANNEIDKLADLAIAAFDEGEDVSKMKKEVSAIFHGPQAVDIALFGRMLADAPDLNTDASAQVAHAFSIDQITPEYDYFTAVDDCASEDNAGAAMIDTVGFNSSTLYRYATVNIDVLRDQLQDDSATVEGVVAFVEAFVKSMPSGKQNTFANHTLPEDVVVTLRESQPISAADAFEDPVRRKDGISVSRQGVERLGERLNDIRVNYGEEPVKAWYVATGGAVSSLNEWCEQVSLPDLEQSLKETLNAAYSA
mgnify:CR=1 FL=1